MDIMLNSTDDLSTDIVEDFARQLDEVVRIQSDDDEDEDNFGYAMLPQDEDDEEGTNMYQALESDEEEEDVQDIQDPFTIEVSSSDSLNPETTDLIKSIMANIQLSDEAIPEWAKKIPESAWLPRVNPKTD
ncbi:hypothetical protein BD770DRAFT_406462 [Pilaira anomala]|nr:hypothetical protein BD770DRAFT_406462 [Pilaira anomala]